jgi:hypothetical protein
MSDYEAAREVRVRQNEAALKQLGVSDAVDAAAADATTAKRAPKRALKRRVAAADVPPRRSGRARSAVAAFDPEVEAGRAQLLKKSTAPTPTTSDRWVRAAPCLRFKKSSGQYLAMVNVEDEDEDDGGDLAEPIAEEEQEEEEEVVEEREEAETLETAAEGMRRLQERMRRDATVLDGDVHVADYTAVSAIARLRKLQGCPQYVHEGAKRYGKLMSRETKIRQIAGTGKGISHEEATKRARTHNRKILKEGSLILREATLATDRGLCTCPGLLDTGVPCGGCNKGNMVRALHRCAATAQVWDHHKTAQRALCKRLGKWPTVNCACGGACALMNEHVKSPWLPPSKLRSVAYVRANPDVFRRHLQCVAHSICHDCHGCFTSDRGTIHD